MKIRRFFIIEDAGAMDADQIRMTEIKLFDNSNKIKSKIAKWAESMGAAFIKDYLPYNVVIEDKYTEEVMQAFQHDIDGTGESNFYFKDPQTGKLHREKPKETESFKELSEGGTTTGGGYWAGEDADGNATGVLGPAAGEDPPPGHGYLGNRYRRGDYDNRLTNYNTIWRVDDGEDFIWDWFPMAAGQEDYANFSETIDKVKEVFPEEVWNNVVKKMTNVPKRLRSSRFSILKGQPYRTSDNTLSKHPEDQQGGTETADVPKEIVMEDKLEKYLNEAGMITGGYPDDGSTGPASDDDQPPGNIVVGPRSVRKDYFNKLTQYSSIWDYDDTENFQWDEFGNLGGQSDKKNYHQTLDKMGQLFSKSTMDNTWKKMRDFTDAESTKDFKTPPNNQGWRDSKSRLGDRPEWMLGGVDSPDIPKEIQVKEGKDVTQKIDKLLVGGTGVGNDNAADKCDGTSDSPEKRSYTFHRNTNGRKRRKSKKLSEQSKVAKTILKQINAIDRFALASWGAKNYVSSDDSIQFDVRGSKFRGRVIITYDRGPDTYVVELGQVRKLEWKQKYMLKSVFAQDLVNVLDQQVG